MKLGQWLRERDGGQAAQLPFLAYLRSGGGPPLRLSLLPDPRPNRCLCTDSPSAHRHSQVLPISLASPLSLGKISPNFSQIPLQSQRLGAGPQVQSRSHSTHSRSLSPMASQSLKLGLLSRSHCYSNLNSAAEPLPLPPRGPLSLPAWTISWFQTVTFRLFSQVLSRRHRCCSCLFAPCLWPASETSPCVHLSEPPLLLSFLPWADYSTSGFS